MKIARKVELTKVSLASITRHDDAPIEVIDAALAELAAYVEAERAAAAARREERKAAALKVLQSEMQSGVSH